MKSAVAPVEYEISTADLEVVLTLARACTLARAGLQLGVAASTVFRTIQRVEKGLGQRLFERSRSGYRANELGEQFCRHAAAIENELQAARSVSSKGPDRVSGLVRISAVDAVLHSFVLPAIATLRDVHRQLRLELQGSNELKSLTHREVDIVLRSTNSPPGHLVGKRLGTMKFAVYGARGLGMTEHDASVLSLPRLAALPWIGVDEAMPDHPGVMWRMRFLPMVRPVVQVNSMVTAARAIETGVGVGVMARFHGEHNRALMPVSPVLEHCEIGLWILTHPESRHLQRIATVARCIEQHCLSAFPSSLE